MGLLRWIAKRAAKYAGIPLRDPALVAMLGRQPVVAGVDVDEATALNFSAVWAAVNLLSQSVATLPINVYKRGASGKTAEDHPAWMVLAVSPNHEMTPVVFHETLQAHLLTWGNAYARIQREENSPEAPVVALWPILPNQVEPDRDRDTGEIYYRFRPVHPGEKSENLQPWEVLHVPGLGFDGLRGYSVIQMARESIGLGMATEKYGAAFFGRGARPGGLITHPGELGEQAIKNLRESWELMHRRTDNASRVAILDEGMKWDPTVPDDAQFLQTRQFQIIEIARWFNVPPHMLRDLMHATFSNIEHQGIDFLTYSLRPWLIKWAQEYERKLFTYEERRAYYVAHVATAMLQTDTKARYDSYRTGRNVGFLTVNEIRERENLPPVDDAIGNTLLRPANMIEAGSPTFDPKQLTAASDFIARWGLEDAAALTILHEAARGCLDEGALTSIITSIKETARGEASQPSS